MEWPLHHVLPHSKVLTPELQVALREVMSDALLVQLSDAAAAIDPAESAVLALDWVNGRRTPDANQALKGALMNLTMGTNAPRFSGRWWRPSATARCRLWSGLRAKAFFRPMLRKPSFTKPALGLAVATLRRRKWLLEGPMGFSPATR